MKPTKTGLAIIVLALLAAQGLFFQYRFFADRQRLSDEVVELSARGRTLESQIATLREEGETLRSQLREQGVEPQAPVSSAPRPRESQRLDAVRELVQLQARYATLQTSVTELHNRAGELEGTVERLTEENKRLLGAEADLKDQLASTQRVVKAMDAELKSKADRVAQLEASLRKYRDEAAGADRRLSQISEVVNELEDINRRRENYLTSLQRRYREITDQLRGLAMRLDTQRDSPSSAGITDVSRINTAVQSAEEDLRQITSLNAQAQRVARRLR